MGKGVEEWTGQICTLLWATVLGQLGGRAGIVPLPPLRPVPLLAGFVSQLFRIWATPPPRATIPAPAPTSPAGGFSSLSGLWRGGALGPCRCFYDYIVCVGGSDVGVARERAVPGRSFINVTHIMILSAASY